MTKNSFPQSTFPDANKSFACIEEHFVGKTQQNHAATYCNSHSVIHSDNVCDSKSDSHSNSHSDSDSNSDSDSDNDSDSDRDGNVFIIQATV